MEVIEDNRICGKTLGTSFASAIRPDPKTKKCPTNYLPCSKYTSADNTICYRTGGERDKVCPITEIKYKYFDTKDKAKQWADADKYDWDLEDYDKDENLWMLWTKDADSLPITNSKFEPKPCMSPTESSIYDTYRPHPAEKKISKCSKSPLNNQIYDPRYIDTGIDTNLMDVHDENKVDEKMRSAYGHDYGLGSKDTYTMDRRYVDMNLWTRPTLSWKLSCEATAGMTRADMYNAVKNPYEFPDRIFVAAIFAFICVGIEACACGAGLIGTMSDNSEKATGARLIAVICSGVLVVNIVWMAQTGASYLRKEQAKVEKYDMVNTCAD